MQNFELALKMLSVCGNCMQVISCFRTNLEATIIFQCLYYSRKNIISLQEQVCHLRLTIALGRCLTKCGCVLA